MDVARSNDLADRMRRSDAQKASVSREVEERSVERQARIEREIARNQDLDREFGIE